MLRLIFFSRTRQEAASHPYLTWLKDGIVSCLGAAWGVIAGFPLAKARGVEARHPGLKPEIGMLGLDLRVNKKTQKKSKQIQIKNLAKRQ